MVKGISLRAKLLVAFFSVASLVGIIGAINYRSLHTTQEHLDEVLNSELPHIVELQALDEQAVELRGQVHTYVDDDQTAITKEDEKRQLEAGLAQFEENYAAFKNSFELEDSDHADLTADAESYVQAAHALIELKSSADATADLIAQEASFLSAYDALNNTIDHSIEADVAHLEELDEIFSAETIRVRRVALAAIVLAITAAGVLGTIISFRIARSLRKLREGATRIANGDFSQNITIASRDETGELAAAFNQMSDRLRDSYHRLALETELDQTLLESLGEGLVAVDEKANITLINNKAVDLLELANKEAAAGSPINQVLELYQNDTPVPEEKTPAIVALESIKSTSEVYTFVQKDGAKRLLNITANPVLLNENVVGVIMVFRDVTKEKEIDRMKTEFISLASHQLRTPLSAIKWFSEMLVNGDAGNLSDEQLDFARNIEDSTERMIDLVNALLNISRIESGRIIVDPKPTDLGELVQNTVNDLKAKIEEKQQSLIISVHKELGKINIDPHLIGQVYMNFLSNAIKYTPKGGEITVFISRKDDEIVSQITDNGYGIPLLQQNRLFQKFFRAENVAKIETDGTGLGLYLVKAIIESSGGKVWFKSEENKGTTFWFSLPVTGMEAREGEVTLDA